MELTLTKIMWLKVGACFIFAILFGIVFVISANLNSNNTVMMVGKIVLTFGAGTGGIHSIWTAVDELP
jgi:hypothetical protein